VHYIILSNPTTPNLSLPRRRARARSQGYRIARDHYASTFSLMERLRGPLHGLDHAGLGEIANAIDGSLDTVTIDAVIEELLRLRERALR
jgi:hypothetical protein